MSDTMASPGRPEPAAEQDPAAGVQAVQETAPAHTAEAPPPGPEYDPGAPAPLGVERQPTRNTEVDAALARLSDADGLTTDGHVEVYEDVHRGLRDTLTALDSRPGPPAPPR